MGAERPRARAAPRARARGERRDAAAHGAGRRRRRHLPRRRDLAQGRRRPDCLTRPLHASPAPCLRPCGTPDVSLAQLVERQLAVGGQPGDADADEPQRTRAVAQPAVEQAAGELGDPLRPRRSASAASSSANGSRSRCSGASSSPCAPRARRGAGTTRRPSAIRRSSAWSVARSVRSRSNVSSVEIEIRSPPSSRSRGSIPRARSRSSRPTWPGSTARSSTSSSAARRPSVTMPAAARRSSARGRRPAGCASGAVRGTAPRVPVARR